MRAFLAFLIICQVVTAYENPTEIPVGGKRVQPHQHQPEVEEGGEASQGNDWWSIVFGPSKYNSGAAPLQPGESLQPLRGEGELPSVEVLLAQLERSIS